VCLRLENIGGAKVTLQGEGTGVQISHMAKEQENAPAEMRWQHYRVRRLRHAWIEPGETIADELLMRLPFTPEVMEVKMRMVLNRHIGRNHRASKANPLPQRWRRADPQADHERNIEERGCQSRMSSESALRTERLTNHKVIKPRRAAPSLRR
jgi:hypothetical protein